MDLQQVSHNLKLWHPDSNCYVSSECHLLDNSGSTLKMASSAKTVPSSVIWYWEPRISKTRFNKDVFLSSDTQEYSVFIKQMLLLQNRKKASTNQDQDSAKVRARRTWFVDVHNEITIFYKELNKRINP